MKSGSLNLLGYTGPVTGLHFFTYLVLLYEDSYTTIT